MQDSGFVIQELNGFPGPYTKYVLATIGVDGLLKLMEGQPNRRCGFAACVGFADARGISCGHRRIAPKRCRIGTGSTELLAVSSSKAEQGCLGTSHPCNLCRRAQAKSTFSKSRCSTSAVCVRPELPLISLRALSSVEPGVMPPSGHWRLLRLIY